MDETWCDVCESPIPDGDTLIECKICGLMFGACCAGGREMRCSLCEEVFGDDPDDENYD